MIKLDATLITAILIVAIAGAISGLAGFGFGLVSVPPLLLIYDPATVVVLVKVLALATSWLILLDSWREVRWRTLPEILPTALLGQVLGIVLLRDLDTAALKFLASVVVVGFALIVLRGFAVSGADRKVAGLAAGGASGILSTSTGLSGPPIVFLFTLRHYPVATFRATTVVYFVIIDLAILPALVAQDIVTHETIWSVLLLAPAAFVGRYVGARLTRFFSPPQFRRFTLALLIVTGFIGIAGALQSLI